MHSVIVMRLKTGHFVLESEEFMWKRRQVIRKIGRMDGAER